MKPIATTIAALVAAGALISACGGDDDGGGDGETDVLGCIEDAGLDAQEQAGDQAIGLTQVIYIDLPEQQNRVIVNVFEDSDAASSYQEGQGAFLEGAGGGGSSEIVGDDTVVAVARSGAEEEFETVKGCVEG